MYLDRDITRCNKYSCKIHRVKLLQLFSQQEKNLTVVALNYCHETMTVR